MRTSQQSLRSVCAVLGALLLLSLPVAAGVAEGPDQLGALELTARDGAVTSGQFGQAGSVIEFTSRMETPSTVAVEIKVNDVVLSAEVDLMLQEVRWTGYGGALFREDREALIAFAGGLETELGALRAMLPSHEQMLYRLAFYWAEAPVGMTLGPHEISATKPSFDQAKTRRVGSEPGGLESLLEPDSKAAECCYCSDNNGVSYLSCKYQYNVLCHDADNGGHCWGCESVLSGCGGGCMGECGPGCAGLNIVTMDCGDHDRCCQVHGGCFNPFDSNCGDEYGEAADDFLLGWPNCSCS